MLDRLADSAEGRDRVALQRVVDAIGRRSFGPLLLVAGLLAVSPLSGIPGVATSVGMLVMIIAVQLLMGRESFWLPQWLLNRSISKRHFDFAVRFLHEPARVADRHFRPRLEVLTRHGGLYIIAVVCVIVGLSTPPMELTPFAITIAGLVFSMLGLAIIAHDGLLAIMAITFVVGIYALLLASLL